MKIGCFSTMMPKMIRKTMPMMENNPQHGAPVMEKEERERWQGVRGRESGVDSGGGCTDEGRDRGRQERRDFS